MGNLGDPTPWPILPCLGPQLPLEGCDEQGRNLAPSHSASTLPCANSLTASTPQEGPLPHLTDKETEVQRRPPGPVRAMQP